MNPNCSETCNSCIPIERKLNLTISEAAEYSNIGLNKINEMLKNPMCDFVLYVGNSWCNHIFLPAKPAC